MEKPKHTKESRGDYTEFTIKVKMKDRWVPHFLAMLDKMRYYGSIGSSRKVGIYSDGDGDFNPEFEWHEDLPKDAEPISDDNGDVIYDAG